MHDSKRDVENLLHEEAEVRSIRERLRQKQQSKMQRQKRRNMRLTDNNYLAVKMQNIKRKFNKLYGI